MSDNDAKSFLDKIKNDPDVRDALVNAIVGGATNGAIESGKQLGLNFSAEELVSAYASDMRAMGLTDEKLKGMASGGTPVLYGASSEGDYAAHPAYAKNPAYADHPGYGNTDESSKYADGSAAYAKDS